METIKTAFNITQTVGTPLDTFLLNLCSTLIGPHMPSPYEIQLNQIQECPGKPPQPIDQKAMCNYLILKKGLQQEYFDRMHNVHPLPEVIPNQEVLFILPAKQNAYIPAS